MPKAVDFSGKPFHFIGIGGIGMSALAYILAKRNLPVSGSDIRLNHITERLQSLGAHIFWSQEASNLAFFQHQVEHNIHQTPNATEATQVVQKLPQLPQIICSTAIHQNNAEYQAAINLGCPIFHRSDLLAALMQEYESIAVAGTHGKTTTSSLIGYILYKAGLDPTVIVGGEVSAWEGNARSGQSDYLVAEADESDGSLVKFAPQIGVITNIELDHPDHYQSLEQVIETFQTFAQSAAVVVGNWDCQTLRDRLQPQISYSLDPNSKADYSVDQITYDSEGTTAQVWERGQNLGQLRLRLLGSHNLSNALAAIAVGRYLGVPFATLVEAISTFEGAKRRFEFRGEANGITFIDDYAHHPSEIRATLASARLQAQNRRVVAIFQPHRYSRTLTFLGEFAQAFTQADAVAIAPIYSAGELNLGQVTGEQLADQIGQYQSPVYYQPDLEAMTTLIKQILEPGDLALFLGAGNLNQIIPQVIEDLQQKSSNLLKAQSA